MRFLKSHCTGYEYFKDRSIVYIDISCFDLTIEFFQTRIVINDQILNKIKIAVRILSQKGHKYDENMR